MGSRNRLLHPGQVRQQGQGLAMARGSCMRDTGLAVRILSIASLDERLLIIDLRSDATGYVHHASG